MPVLSIQITDTPPNVSAAASFLTKPFLFNIFCIPIVRTIVRDTNKPSGILETAKATEVMKISVISIPRKTPTIKTKRIIDPIIINKWLLNLLS